MSRELPVIIERLEDRQLLSVFQVTNTADLDMYSEPVPGSLRDAIIHANSDFDPQSTIVFAIQGSGVQTIFIGNTTLPPSQNSPLPAITHPVILDGTTELTFQQGQPVGTPGSSPGIQLVGNNPGVIGDGLDISGGNSTVRGLVINRFTGNGIVLDTKGGDKVANNIIGLSITASGGFANGGSGVFIDDVSNNTIGGLTTSDRNIISRNGRYGIQVGTFGVESVSSDNNVIQSNYIGTGINRADLFANSAGGVAVFFGKDNVIGSTTAPTTGAPDTPVMTPTAPGNLISGNGGPGVLLAQNNTKGEFDQFSDATLVQGNLIGGTNPDLNQLYPNQGYGVEIHGANNHVSYNEISGNLTSGLYIGFYGRNNTASSNFIYDNSAEGVFIQQPAIPLKPDNSPDFDFFTANNSISANNIDRNLGNGIHIILLNGRDVGFPPPQSNLSNTIGGTTAADGNFIHNNFFNGILIDGLDTNPTENVIVQNNTSQSNRQNGISLSYAANNTVQDNDVEQNVGNGIFLLNSGSWFSSRVTFVPGNQLLGNTVANNSSNGLVIQGTFDASSPLNLSSFNTTTRNHFIDNNNDGVDIVNAFMNTMGGPDPADGNVIGGNFGDGLRVTGQTASNNLIQNNWIGAFQDASNSVAGNLGTGVVLDGKSSTTTLLGNHVILNGSDGMFVESYYNTIGGTATSDGNVISSNTGSGISIVGNASSIAPGASPTDIIVTGSTGNQVLGNTVTFNYNGIALTNTLGNTVGGATSGAGNFIAGNKSTGIESDFTTSVISILGNTVAGNTIGLLLDGSHQMYVGLGIHTAASNASSIAANTSITYDYSPNQIIGNVTGVFLRNAFNNWLIANSISGNQQYGVYIFGQSARQNWLAGNTIDGNLASPPPGTMPAPFLSGYTNAYLPGTNTNQRQNQGIVINSANTNYIGPANTITNNLIGIEIVNLNLSPRPNLGANDPFSTEFNTIQGNTIATNLIGIRVNASTNTQILGNQITANVGIGVDLKGALTTNNFVRGNNISQNVGYNAAISPNPISGGRPILVGHKNTTLNVTYNLGTGVYIEGGNGNEVSNNTLNGNLVAGVYIFLGANNPVFSNTIGSAPDPFPPNQTVIGNYGVLLYNSRGNFNQIARQGNNANRFQGGFQIAQFREFTGAISSTTLFNVPAGLNDNIPLVIAPQAQAVSFIQTAALPAGPVRLTRRNRLA